MRNRKPLELMKTINLWTPFLYVADSPAQCAANRCKEPTYVRLQTAFTTEGISYNIDVPVCGKHGGELTMHKLYTEGKIFEHQGPAGPTCLECRDINYKLALADIAETISFWPDLPLARVLKTKLDDAINLRYIE